MKTLKGYQVESDEVLFFIDKNNEYIDALEILVTVPKGNFMESLDEDEVHDILANQLAQPTVNNSYFSEFKAYKNADGQVILSILVKESISYEEASKYEEAFVELINSSTIQYLSGILKEK